MLINLRDALMTGKRLPYDAEVEYLESTGTQWIDTGVMCSGNLDIETCYSVEALTANNNIALYGVVSGQGGFFSGLGSPYNSPVYYINNIQNIVTSLSFAIDNIYVDHTDGTTYRHNNESATVASQSTIAQTLPIFGRKNANGNIERIGTVKLRSFKIWDNGTLVRDFIPVRKGTVGYLYDRVSGKLFGNAGTGDFVVGQDVVPVEYLGFGGSQYINTGLTVKSTLHVSFDVQVDGICWVFGGRTQSGSNQFSLQQYAVDAARPAYGNTGANISNVATGRHTFDFNQNVFSVDSVVKQTFTAQTFSASSPVYLGTLSVTDSGTAATACLTGRAYGADIWDNGDPVRKFAPVRVGTEGAMMDVLTRRIYRNQGTGAFTYGNDLPYPIPT